MPYRIQKRGTKWAKINKLTGKVVSRHNTKKLAQKSVRAYYSKKGS